MKPSTSKKGFTLIELLVAIVIVGILAALAYPSYQDYIYRTRRTDGKTVLMNLANYMEHFYTENNTYVGATLGSGGTLGLLNTSPDGYYTVAITTQTATAYTLTATPVSPQNGDTTCTTLTLTNTNVRGATPAANAATCWK